MSLNIYDEWNEYYKKHPFRWISARIRSRKAAKDRIKKGFCVYDWANFDDWFVTIIPAMFREWAEKGMGYPGTDEYDTYEKWSSWLKSMADKIEDVGKIDEKNEFDKQLMAIYYKNLEHSDILTGSDDLEHKELIKKSCERELEIRKENKEKLRLAMNELIDNWDYLWD